MENQEPVQEAVEQETFPLDDAAIEMLADYDQQEVGLNTARNALLSYFARQHKLQGKWQLATNRKELIKAQ